MSEFLSESSIVKQSDDYKVLSKQTFPTFNFANKNKNYKKVLLKCVSSEKKTFFCCYKSFKYVLTFCYLRIQAILLLSTFLYFHLTFQ